MYGYTVLQYTNQLLHQLDSTQILLISIDFCINLHQLADAPTTSSTSFHINWLFHQTVSKPTTHQSTLSAQYTPRLMTFRLAAKPVEHGAAIFLQAHALPFWIILAPFKSFDWRRDFCIPKLSLASHGSSITAFACSTFTMR